MPRKRNPTPAKRGRPTIAPASQSVTLRLSTVDLAFLRQIHRNRSEAMRAVITVARQHPASLSLATGIEAQPTDFGTFLVKKRPTFKP